MKTSNFKYGSLNFEINLWDKEFYYHVMKLNPVENVEGAVEIGWCLKPTEIELLYVFPIINGQIDWQTYPENAILIPEDVQEQAKQILLQNK